MAELYRQKSPAEEMINAITHGLGALLSIVGLITLIVLSVRAADPWRIITFSIYGGTLVLLYLASTCYHACPYGGRAKQFFHVLDHAAIYFLIAGTYTPFMLVSVGGAWGWSIVGTLWVLATVGTFVKSRRRAGSSHLSTLLYVAMGWIGLIAAGPIIQVFSTECLFWIIGGGVAYTAGVIFFVWDRLPFNHAIWHLFVLKGSVCHFLAILLYVLPTT